MQDNKFLGDCLAVVCNLSEQEQIDNNLTSSDVLIYIKFGKKLKIKGKDIDFKHLIDRSYFKQSKPILLRIGCECALGVFGDSHCDCEYQRIASLSYINDNGQGIYIHIPQEAQGRGVFYKAKELCLQVSGHDPEGRYVGEKSLYDAANYLLGHEQVDIRKYGFLNNIFTDLHLNSIEYVLITDSIKKADTVKDITNVKVIGHFKFDKEMTKHNISAYLDKIYSNDHKLDDKDIVKLIEFINVVEDLPERAKMMLVKLDQGLKNGRDFHVNTKLLRLLSVAAKRHLQAHMI
jgi:GTP cyclohydrolase II